MAASGAPITLKTKEDFRTTFGVTLRDYYALSECTPIFSFDLRPESGSTPPPGSVGQLVRGAEVTLLGDDEALREPLRHAPGAAHAGLRVRDQVIQVDDAALQQRQIPELHRRRITPGIGDDARALARLGIAGLIADRRQRVAEERERRLPQVLQLGGGTTTGSGLCRLVVK